MHPIRRYVESEDNLNQAKFARRLGLSPQFLNDVIQGRCYMGRENALNVVKMSGGSVTLAELMTWEAETA